MKTLLTVCLSWMCSTMLSGGEQGLKAQPSEPIPALFADLKAKLPVGWEVSYLGEDREFKDAHASLRYAIKVVRKKPVRLKVATIGSPRGPEISNESVEFIIYPEPKRIKGGIGWHSFRYKQKFFSLREPYAGIGTYAVASDIANSGRIQAGIDGVKEAVLGIERASTKPAVERPNVHPGAPRKQSWSEQGGARQPATRQAPPFSVQSWTCATDSCLSVPSSGWVEL